jgi:hypothetical protein
MEWVASLEFTDPMGGLYLVLRMSVVASQGAWGWHDHEPAHVDGDPEIISAECTYADEEQDCGRPDRDTDWARTRMLMYLDTYKGRQWLLEQAQLVINKRKRDAQEP